jgi:flagellin
MTLGYSGDGDHQDGTPNDGFVAQALRKEMLTIGEVTQPLLVMVVGSGVFSARARWTDAPTVTSGAADSGLDVVLQADFGQGVQSLKLTAMPADQRSLGLSSSRITTQSAARSSLDALDQAIGRIGQYRGQLGAMHGRLEQALELSTSTAQDLCAARGRITDADMAAELGALTRQQVLAQAGQVVRSQATDLPRQMIRWLLGPWPASA